MVTDCETRNEIPKPYELISSDDRLSIRFEIREKERERERNSYLSISFHLDSFAFSAFEKKKKENVSTLRARKRTNEREIHDCENYIIPMYRADIRSAVSGITFHSLLNSGLRFRFFSDRWIILKATLTAIPCPRQKRKKKKKKKSVEFFNCIYDYNLTCIFLHIKYRERI